MTGAVAGTTYYDPTDPRSFPGKKVKEKPTCIEKIRGTVLHPDMPVWCSSLGGLARAVSNLVEPVFKWIQKLKKVLAATQFTSALTMPFDLHQLCLDVDHLIFEKGKRARIDNALSVTANASQLGDGMATFTSALVDLGAAPGSAMQWAAPFGLACAGVSSVFFAIHGRALFYNVRMLREIDEALKGPPSKILQLVDRRAYHLGQYCGVDVDLFKETVEKLVSKQPKADASQEERDKHASNLAKAYSAIKTRIQHKKFSHSLGIVITAISIIASVILFATPLTPWGIAAYSLLAVLFILSMTKMSFEVYANRRFKRELRAIG